MSRFVHILEEWMKKILGFKCSNNICQLYELRKKQSHQPPPVNVPTLTLKDQSLTIIKLS